MFGADGGGFAVHNHPSLPSLPPTTTLLSRPQPPFSAAHNHPFTMKVVLNDAFVFFDSPGF
ncbi:hypothetical protein HanXRQr2_Chr08g0347361 [Helianthus annuus]|uniref:Uncharacterized protein n=1 Tax=Helianthus annuus TaxID=4232 RepID=A0A251U7V5_HELAN|nr:hypothetical protein HanXRQr2_Chr08g0347361 [Helianthus annuus]KAJ0547667.1 hypothetical protein HanIR_Chr08g0374741 [Helianthus annuus]KAJ0902317.1 hypothetical protein HanPSC8_Chr08g0335591 [Helianthus annuus]